MTQAVTATAPPPAPAVDKRAQVESLLHDVLRLMEYPARLELKDMPDGGIGVAVHFETELPGIVPGKRSYLVDCVQFLVNKIVNRPNTERRWVTLGVNGFPEPRPQRGPQEPAAPKPSAPKSAPAPAAASSSGAKPVAAEGTPAKGQDRQERGAKKPNAERPERSASQDNDERSLKVEPSFEMTRLATSLATKSTTRGRFYGVMLLSKENRARVMAAAASTSGVTVKPEGEGHWRRVSFVPEKPVVIPKKQVMPDYDDEEE